MDMESESKYSKFSFDTKAELLVAQNKKSDQVSSILKFSTMTQLTRLQVLHQIVPVEQHPHPDPEPKHD